MYVNIVRLGLHLSLPVRSGPLCIGPRPESPPHPCSLFCCPRLLAVDRAIMSPILGRRSTRRGYKETFTIATCLLLVGAFAYAIAANNVEVFLSQVSLGVGSGTLGVTRAYVADKTTKAQRTYLLAYTA